MSPELPQCPCGSNNEFVLREFRRTTGSFGVCDDRLTFREHHDTADLERDAVLCGSCFREVAVGDFDVEA